MIPQPPRASGLLALTPPLLLFLASACGGGPATPGNGSSLPAGFPADLPIYPNAAILQSDVLGAFLVVQLLTQDPLQDVVRFYEDALARGRWKLLASEDVPGQTAHAFHFTAEGLPSGGTVVVSQAATGTAGTAVAISLPQSGR